MAKIIGIGNALVDALVRLQDEEALERLGLPKGGMMLIDDARRGQLAGMMQGMAVAQATGGSAGNTVLAVAQLGGGSPAFVGCVGDDAEGRFFHDNCAEVGIEARLIRREGRTGVAHTFITPDGERTFATHLGVAASLSAQDVGEGLLAGGTLLHVEGYLVQNHALVEAICQTARRMGMLLSIDLASYNVVRDNLAFMRHLVCDYMDIVFANEEESAAFSSTDDPEAALRDIASLCDVAVVKLGKRGAIAMHHADAQPVACPARRVQVADTTAAGDFFAGGFLHALTRGAGLPQCLQVGTLLSSNVVQVVGSRLSEEAWAQIRVECRALLGHLPPRSAC